MTRDRASTRWDSEEGTVVDMDEDWGMDTEKDPEDSPDTTALNLSSSHLMFYFG